MSLTSEEELTAWHESGHAFVAVLLGGRVHSVSIDPDYDDGPVRHGDTTIHWRAPDSEQREHRENSILVALAGPVAEMIRRGDPFHPATVGEWTQDWQLAWNAADFVGEKQKRMKYLEHTTIQLYRTLSQDRHWAAIGAIVDHLLAYEIIEGETVHEIVAEWTD